MKVALAAPNKVRRLVLTATRVGVPLAMAVAGIVVVVVEHGQKPSHDLIERA